MTKFLRVSLRVSMAFATLFAAFSASASQAKLTKRTYKSGESIAIIGAGVTGLSLARTLIAKGVNPSLITIIDELPYAGGKVRTANVDGRPYEVGAAVIIQGRYTLIEDMAKAYGLTTRPLEPTKFLDVQTGKPAPDMTADDVAEFRTQVGYYLGKYANEWSSVSSATGFSKIPASLDGTWADFLGRQGTNVDKLMFRLSTALGGSGYVMMQNPPFAAQIVRYINPSLVKAVLGPGNVRVFDPLSAPCTADSPADFPMGGYQCLWVREAKSLQDTSGVKFHFNTRVQSINRGAQVVIKTLDRATTTATTSIYDHAFFSGDLRYLKNGLLRDVTKKELKLYSAIGVYPYRTYLMKMKNFPIDNYSGIFGLLPYMKDGADGKGVLVARPYKDTDVYQMWAYGDETVTHDSILSIFENDMKKLGVSFDRTKDVIEQHQWEYFPHVEPKSGYTLETFFNEAMANQGVGGLWYAGEVFGFGLTIDVYEQAKTFGEMFVDGKL